MKEKIIAQGAEAVLIRCGEQVLKRRVAKGYRLKELDEKIRKLRTRSEAKLLEKAGKIISAPRVLKMDEKATEIDMEFISGLKLSDELDEMENWKEVCFAIGENIAKLHDVGIIHGDLTTSNMIWVAGVKEKNDMRKLLADSRFASSARHNIRLASLAAAPSAHEKISHDSARQFLVSAESKRKGRLYLIDFGLGFQNGRIEDKAVDLYLIKEALEAKHFKRFNEYFATVVEGYTLTSKQTSDVLNRLKAVEKRGRYKANY